MNHSSNPHSPNPLLSNKKFFFGQDCLLIILVLCATAVWNVQASTWQVLDRVILPADTRIAGLTVGGLSGVAWDAKTGLLWVVSDGRQWGTSKIFRFQCRISPEGKMTLQPHSLLSLQTGKEKREPLDAEGIALWSKNRLFVSHEGSRSGHLAAGIACFDAKSGMPLFSLPVPEYFYASAAHQERGMQNNRGFEAVCISRPQATHLHASIESPLIQDLENPKDAANGPVRILRFPLANQAAEPEQRAYFVERDGLFGSVPELLSIQDGRLLVLERHIVWPIPPQLQRIRTRIRIFEVDFSQKEATDISHLSSLRGIPITPLKKQLLFDSSLAGIRDFDNLEGMTWGPTIQGRPTLLLVSDDNFSKTQKTEFVLLGERE